MPDLHVLRVFTAPDGTGGNALGVVLDGAAVEPGARQGVAAALGFSETVFVDDAETGQIRIYTPAVELEFAGHPTVGTAWLLARERGSIEVLRPPAGEAPAHASGNEAFVTADPAWGPTYDWQRLGAPEEVDSLDGPLGDGDLVGYWAWLDEQAGLLRARVFPVRLGIAEDEATGGAAIGLCSLLGRQIEIHQGLGSVLHARPGPASTVELGGRVELEGVRQL